MQRFQLFSDRGFYFLGPIDLSFKELSNELNMKDRADIFKFDKKL
jgi:hypothetical protein